MCFNGEHNHIDAPPLVLILSPPSNHAEWLKYINDIVDTPSLHSQLFGALVQVEDTFALDAVVIEEASAEFS